VPPTDKQIPHDQRCAKRSATWHFVLRQILWVDSEDFFARRCRHLRNCDTAAAAALEDVFVRGLVLLYIQFCKLGKIRIYEREYLLYPWAYANAYHHQNDKYTNYETNLLKSGLFFSLLGISSYICKCVQTIVPTDKSLPFLDSAYLCF
jgi:hypothetical protein